MSTTIVYQTLINLLSQQLFSNTETKRGTLISIWDSHHLQRVVGAISLCWHLSLKKSLVHEDHQDEDPGTLLNALHFLYYFPIER